MKRILFFFLMLAAFASAQTDSTDILITIREDGDTTQVGRWRAGMPVIIRASWDGWGEREKQGNKFVIVRVGIAKARIDSFLVNHTDSTTGLRRKYQLSRAAIQFVKNNRDANNIVRVTPAQLRNAFKRANRIRRFSEPQRMSIIPDRLYIRWRNMLIGATQTSATVNTDGGGDYTSLAAAEAGEQKDLETANEQLTINCSGTTSDVTAVVFDGWTTDATRNIIIQGDNNTGAWNSSNYRLEYTCIGTTLPANTAIYVDGAYVTLRNFQMRVGYNATTSQMFGFRTSSTATTIVESSIFRGDLTNNASSFTTGLVYFNDNISIIRNCILYNVNNNTENGTLLRVLINKVYNCTLYNADKYGIQSNSFPTVKNTVVQNCGQSIGGSNKGTGDYNFDDDNEMIGANTITGTAIFADAANGDFRLLAGSLGIDQGVDLSADPSYPFNTDIIGTTRPQGSGWNIGAFEYVQPATTNNDKKSRYKGFGTAFKGGWKK